MESIENLFSLNINTTYRIGGHFYLPQNEEWTAENDIFDQNIFYYILSGSCVIDIDGKKYDGKAGDWFFIPAGTRYSYHNDTAKPFEKYWIHFDLYPSSDLLQSLRLEYSVRAKNSDEIEKLFKDFTGICKSVELHDRIRINAIILMLLSEYIKHADQSSAPVISTPTNELYRVLNYINQNLEKPLSNTMLADYLHIHPNHFIRYFKSEIGETPQRYVMLRRIEWAKRLLEETSLSISDIAELTGLCDGAHLSKLFKRIYAISPSQYRKGSVQNLFSFKDI